MPLSPGTRVGPFEVVAVIGRGGMGEVFRARDTGLRRDVALKALPAVFESTPERLSRFEREAQILASLNHPNIAAIYGFADIDGGGRALVLELVDGPTLADRLLAGPLPASEAVAIAHQMCEALDAAHERGVVHRDLKPGNVKLSPDGVVKLLDFGLAKIDREGAASVTQSTVLEPTVEGVVLGTAAYMSPEQARGRSVDKRTDIWAFGVVLYEMLTGHRAFAAETTSDTMAAVLGRDPEWTRLPATTPAGVRRLLRRCLEKDPKERLRDIGDARVELRETETTPVDDQSGGAAASRQWWLAAAAVAGIVLVIAMVVATRDRELPASSWQNPLANAVFTRVTDFAGSEYDAAISGDGKFVAFRADRDGQVDVWLTQLGSGRFVNLTRGKEEELLLPVRSIGFSPDASEIWLAGSVPDNRRLRLMPLMGGTPRPFLRDHTVNVAWSPDGQRVVFHTGDPGDPTFVADRTGANARQIFKRDNPGGHNHFPVWSPDAQWIYFVSGIWDTRQMDVWRISPDGGTPERMTHHSGDVRFLTPLDARTLMYVAAADDGSGPWLWSLDVEQKIARRATSGVEKYTSVAVAADGRRLVATVANPSATLWSVPILDRVADEPDVKPYSVPTVRALTPRFGPHALFYLSSTGAGDGLWRSQGDQVQEIWKGADGPLFVAPDISPDGRRVAIVLNKEGRYRLNVLAADGTELQPLGDALDVRGSASWSPDGKWLAISANDATGQALFKLPVEGGPPVRLLAGAGINPLWSPDGSLIVFTGPNVANQAPLLAMRSDGSPVTLPAIGVRGDISLSLPRHRFLPNGKGLVYMQGASAWQDFWLLDLTTMRSRPLTQFSSRATMRSFDITPDGRQIVFDRLHDNSDIVYIERK
jgi:Tol biopolymer transport system component